MFDWTTEELDGWHSHLCLRQLKREGEHFLERVPIAADRRLVAVMSVDLLMED